MHPVLAAPTLTLALTLALGTAASAERFETSAGPVEVTKVVSGIEAPWGFAFLPDFAETGSLLVTEKSGALRLWESGALSAPLQGGPQVEDAGQGGLLDVALAADFAETGMIYLSYAARSEGGAQTQVMRARLVRGPTPRLEAAEVIFRQEPPQSTRHHYGSRIVVAEDGALFITVGDRGEASFAQDLTRHQGSVIRILPDGRPHPDNPFIGNQRGWREEIFSYGHRNPQGATLGPDGRLWTVEHGARGGDEINLPEAGRNYGWPVISYGRQYSGGRIGVGTTAAGMEQPVHYWDPSIAPSGLTVYSGDLFPEWQGDLIAGALKFQLLSRLDMEGGRVIGEERLLEGEFGRIRDVRTGPDGAIWFATDERSGGIYRMAPAD